MYSSLRVLSTATILFFSICANAVPTTATCAVCPTLDTVGNALAVSSGGAPGIPQFCRYVLESLMSELLPAVDMLQTGLVVLVKSQLDVSIM